MIQESRNQWPFESHHLQTDLYQREFAKKEKKITAIYERQQEIALGKVMRSFATDKRLSDRQYFSARARYTDVKYEEPGHDDVLRRKSPGVDEVFPLKPVYYKRAYSLNNFRKANNDRRSLKPLEAQHLPSSVPLLPLGYAEMSDESFSKQLSRGEFPLEWVLLPPMHFDPGEDYAYATGSITQKALEKQRRYEEPKDQERLAEAIRKKETLLQFKLKRTEAELRRIQQVRVASAEEREMWRRKEKEMGKLKWERREWEKATQAERDRRESVRERERMIMDMERKERQRRERERSERLKEAELGKVRRENWELVQEGDWKRADLEEWERKEEDFRGRARQGDWEDRGRAKHHEWKGDLKDREMETERKKNGEREWREKTHRRREGDWQRREREREERERERKERDRENGFGERRGRMREGEWERREREEGVWQSRDRVKEERVKNRDIERNQNGCPEVLQKRCSDGSYNSKNLPLEHPKSPPARSAQQPGPIPRESQEGEAQLVPCTLCNRSFAAGRMERHLKACKKVQQSNRKVFDSYKHRVKGTELEEFMKTNNRSRTPESKKNNWKQKHEIFIRNVRQGRQMTTGALQPTPPDDVNPDYVSCPHCARRFAPGPAERHIPKCQNIKSRPPPPRRRL